MQIKHIIAQGIEKNLPVDLLKPGKFQPRQAFDESALQELAQSIKEVGILSRIIVRAIDSQYYEIIAGERRWRAAQLAGLQEVPCKIIQCNDEQALQIALIENLARQDLNPIEEAKGIKRLIDEFFYTQEEAAEILSKPRSTITNLLRLLELHPEVQQLIVKKELTESHGKLLVVLSQPQQFFLARETVIKQWSIRELEKAMAELNKKTSITAVNSAGADIQRLQRKLSDYLGASVMVTANKKHKGVLKVNYNSLDELEGILAKIGYTDE